MRDEQINKHQKHVYIYIYIYIYIYTHTGKGDQSSKEENIYTGKYTLEKEIRVAKTNYSNKLRIIFSSSDTASVWKCTKYITS